MMIREQYAFFFEPLLVPVDHRVENAMVLACLEGRDLGIFHREFQKVEKYHSERVTLPHFKRCIEEKRSQLGDAMFEILQIDYYEDITFSEFLNVIILMCMLESKEVIQLLLIVFDYFRSGCSHQNMNHTAAHPTAHTYSTSNTSPLTIHLVLNICEALRSQCPCDEYRPSDDRRN